MATTQIKDGYNGGSDHQLLVLADGSINVNAAITISAITVNQGTSPWVIAGAVTQSGTWTTDRSWALSNLTDSVNVGNFPASFAVTQSTSPWVVSGTVATTQSTSPWVVSGTVSANQSGSWTTGRTWALTSGADSINAVQSGGWSTKTQDGSGNNITSTSNALDVNLKTSSIGLTISGTVTSNQGTSGSSPWLTTDGGSVARNHVLNNYTSTNVTTSAYVQVLASTSAAVNSVEIFDSSGQIMILATGAGGSEVDQIYILPGGNGRIPLAIAASTRISIKAVTATAASGYFIGNFYS